MNKTLKFGLYGIGGFIVLLLLVVAIIAAIFNPNDYKDDVIKLVKEKKDRTLKIEGDIELSFWPKIGADLGKVSISEHKNTAEFASVNSVKVALAVLPLLKKELVVDTVYVNGARANIIKYKDGTTNFDDLISKDDTESETIKFDVDGINITNSAIAYTDEATGAKYSVSKLNLTSGPVALAEPIDLETDFTLAANQPAIAANATLKGNFLVDPETKRFKVTGLDSHITGNMLGGTDMEIKLSGDVDAKPEQMEFLVDGLKLVASGMFDGAKQSIVIDAPALSILKEVVSSKKITVSLSQEKAGDVVKANMVLADMKGSPKTLQSSGITGDLSAVQGKRTITGKFSSPFTGNIEHLVFDLPKLAGSLDIKDSSLPNGGMKGSFNLAAHTEIKNELANSQFNLTIGGVTKLNGDVNVTGFKQSNIKFNLNADQLDLNKLLAKSSAPVKTGSNKANGKPADMSALKSMKLDGKLNVGSILYEKYRVSGLNVGIKADGEKLALSGLNVKVDDSQIKGNLGISNFAKPLYTFDLDIDQVDLDRYVAAAPAKASAKPATDNNKPLDLSALKALNADGSIRIGSLKYGKTKASNVNINLKADGQKLQLNPLSAKVDDSQINANVGISQFSNPAYNFDIKIDRLDADRYIAKGDPKAKSSGDTPIDLSALKKLNATGEATIGWLKLANVKTENVKLGLKASDGIAMLSPFSANLYQGSMAGSLKVDARSTPNIAFKQNMKSVSIGPLLADAINNDMLSGTGTVNIDLNTTGNTVSALKKALAGDAALNLVDGAIKGIDIAGSVREMQSKINVFKPKETVSDKSKKTDFSELTGTFKINAGVAHNQDLAMKAPILRLDKGDSKGDIDIGNEKINYLAKPKLVTTLKGQGGKDADQLSGISIPIKISGSFANPQFAPDYSAVLSAFAQSKLLDKVGGEKGAAVKELLGGDKVEGLKGLLGKKKGTETAPSGPSEDATAPAAPAEKPKSAEEKGAEKLKELFKF